MKPVLIVAYYFPPMGMGGVQRPAKLAKYLPAFGWDPWVLTVKEVLYPRFDPSLLDGIRQSRIVRTDSLDPLRLLGRFGRRSGPSAGTRRGATAERLARWNRRLGPWMNLPDPKALWVPFAFRRARKLVASRGIRVVLTTSPPHSAHWIGSLLKRTEGCAWVADFRDSWLGESFDAVPTPLHRAANRKMLDGVLAGADRITAVSETLVRDLQGRTDRKAGDFVHVPNGFDPEDFDVPAVTRKRNRFKVAYCGTVNAVHTPEPFLDGAGLALAARPELADVLELWFVGSVSGIDLPGMARLRGLDRMIRTTGYVPHAGSIGHMMSADLLLLTVPPGSSGGVITGKLYEYLGSGKPVLAVAPDGEAEKLLRRLKRGPVVRPDRPRDVARALIDCHDQWKRGRLSIGMPRWKNLEPYSRRRQAEVMAGLFDALAAC
jgi:glycosyltransferase involved in cell wall biosynthesis